MPEFANRNDWLEQVRRKLTILLGIANAIDADSHNTPDARHKARLMIMELDELSAMAFHVREVRPSHTEGEETH